MKVSLCTVDAVDHVLTKFGQPTSPNELLLFTLEYDKIKWDFPTRATVDRVQSRCELEDNGCFVWQGKGGRYPELSVLGRNVKASRIICSYFHGPSNGLHALHSCDNPKCCNQAHLSWGTHDENMKQKVLRGRSHRNSGSTNGRAKLSDSQAEQIREKYMTGKYRQIDLAKEYGVNRTQISKITNGLAW